MMMNELRTARLLLRRARADDVDAMHAIMSDAAAMRYWSRLPHTHREETARFIGGMLAAGPDTADEFVVEHQGALIGKAGVWRMPEIGFIFAPAFWGRGFASEALAAIIPHVFARHAVDAITAEADPRNAACLRLLDRLGFVTTSTAERTFLLGEEWTDSVYLALCRPQPRLLNQPSV